MPVRPFTQVGIDEATTVVVPRSIPNAISAFARHNFSNPVQVVNFWPTEVVEGQIYGNYQNNSLQDRPTRTISSSHSALDDSISEIMYQEQFAMQTQAYTALPSDNRYKLTSGYDSVFQCPLYCDQSSITGVSGLVITATGVGVRRFYVGQRVFLVPDCQRGDFEISGPYGVNHATSIIESISGDEITLASAPILTPDVGWLVIPSMDCTSLEEIPESVISGNAVLMSLTAQERVGMSAIPAAASPTGGALSDWATGPLGKYVFDVRHNFAVVPASGFVRSGSRISSGLSGFVNQVGFAARRVWGLVAQLDRESYWKVLQFWDWHRGPCQSFWFPFQKMVWGTGVEVITTNQIRADRRGTNVLFRQNITALAFYDTQGQLEVCRVSGITEQPGGTWLVDLADPLPIDFDIQVVYPTSLVCFSGNELSESWWSTEWVDLSVSIVEDKQNELVEFLAP